MVEDVEIDGLVVAKVIRGLRDLTDVDSLFFTHDQDPLQCGIFNHPSDHKVAMHYHPRINRTVIGTPEFLLLLKGGLRCFFKGSEDDRCPGIEIELAQGDGLLIFAGVHGFETLGETSMLEIKQGPYLNDRDKIKLDPCL